jgi:dTMP kinase
MRSSRRGLFITLEGIEGCGKSTHAALLAKDLTGRGYDCLLTREPGGTGLGEAIRRVLLHSADIRISDLSELFMFEASRSQIIEEIIAPGLAGGKIVICDRFFDATLAYQGYGGGLSLKMIRSMNDFATGHLMPDLTLLLDIDTLEGLKRADVKGSDRMEKKRIDYHKRVRAGYLKLARSEPSRFRIIRVAGSIEDTRKIIGREVDSVIPRY